MSQLRGDKQRKRRPTIVRLSASVCFFHDGTGGTRETRQSHASPVPHPLTWTDTAREKNQTKQVRASCLFKTSEFIYFGCGLMIQRRRPLTAVLCGNTLFIFLIRPRGNMPLLAKGLNQIPLKCLEATDEGAGCIQPASFSTLLDK